MYQAREDMVDRFGILGLSFQALAKDPNPTVLSSMVASGIIPSHLFSIYLTDKDNQGSKILFGGVDTKYM